MDEEKKKDVKQESQTVVNNVGQESAPVKSGKTKVIVISVIAAILAVLAIVGIVAIVKNAGKPSKKQAEKIVKSYLEAINDQDDEALLKQIDVDGYVILKEEEKESKFDKNYKKKSSYMKKFKEDKDLDDDEDVEKLVTKYEKSVFSSYYDYSFKEISSVKKSEKSGKISIIKAKIKQSSSYSDSKKTLTLYVIKEKGKFKVIGSKLS